MAKRFSRCKEDFTCENCKTKVAGNGYTDHCPVCLYGKHVDVNPGDRQNTCRGLMEPISIEKKKGNYVIVHRCLKCGTINRCRSATNDSIKTIIGVSKKGVRYNG